MKTILALPFVSKLINNEMGAAITYVVAGVVGACFAALAHWMHWQADPVQEAHIEAELVGFFTLVATGLLHYYQTGDKKDVQRALGFTGDAVDGELGPVTKAVASYATQATPAPIQEIRRAVLAEADASPLKSLKLE